MLPGQRHNSDHLRLAFICGSDVDPGGRQIVPENIGRPQASAVFSDTRNQRGVFGGKPSGHTIATHHATVESSAWKLRYGWAARAMKVTGNRTATPCMRYSGA